MKLNTNKIHGMSQTAIYHTWEGMKARCYNKNNNRYKNYGGRGIIVCEEWINNFPQFYRDMGNRPGQDYSLDRVNNNKGYSKENCRWATRIQQANNRSIKAVHGSRQMYGYHKCRCELCKAFMSEVRAKYLKENRSDINTKKRAWWTKNKEEVNKKQREYRARKKLEMVRI